MKIPVLIAGAGLSGLCVARTLPRGSYRIFEKEETPGGLCRSFWKDGYRFDYTGHLLHLKGETLTFVETLMGERLREYKRRAAIHILGRKVPYPFQAHVGFLPASLREECLEGFQRVCGREVERGNFERWSRSTFGDGIHRLFMKPYNEKLYRTPLSEMTADWLGWVPRPTRQEIEAGGRGEEVPSLGYNAVFRYPLGGIGVLPEKLSEGIEIETRSVLFRLDPSSRTAWIRKEETKEEIEIRYTVLVSTIPLPDLLAISRNIPDTIRADTEKLRSVGVYCLNVGIRGRTEPYHWLYFPEQEYPFYRVGFYHNFAEDGVPAGCSALYIEISYRDRGEIRGECHEEIFAGLLRAGIIEKREAVEVVAPLYLDFAYAVPTASSTLAVKRIREYLLQRGIRTIGRYGRWAYTSMGEAIGEGLREGQRIREEIL